MTHSRPQMVIRAGESEHQYWKDLLRYRELFYFLAWRDTLVRYKQTAIGIAWALLTMIAFTVVFGSIANLSFNAVLYLILIFSGLLLWQIFGYTLVESIRFWSTS